ncbi:MAG: amino acid permease, partial [Gemmatimonadota bacterium]
RTLGLRDLIFIVVGTVIGSGIFLTPGSVVQNSGSGGVALVVWAVGGVLSLLGALTFAELGASRPNAGGLYVYMRDAFGPALAFLFGWTMFLVIGSGSLATLAAAFPRYVGVFVTLSPAAEKVISILMIAAVAALNVRGTRSSANVQGVATALKALVIVGLAIAFIVAAPERAPQTWWPEHFTLSTFTGAITAMIGVLWAYEGWQYVTFSAGETLDPQRKFGRGIVIGTVLLIGVYVLANVGYIAALGIDGVAASRRVASDAAGAILGSGAAAAVSGVILVSIASAANGLTLTLPRLFYAMAGDRLFFSRLAEVHPRLGTPAASIVATALWSSVLVLSGTFEQLLTYVVFMSWVWFALAAMAIFVLRHREPDAPRPFRTPGYPVTPAAFVLSALVIVGNTVIAQPTQSVIGLGITLAGIPAYLWWRSR